MSRPASPTAKGSAPPGQAGWGPVVESIGPKVRALRQEQGLTLQQLAHAADVSAAAVHKVERGDMVPTVTTLLKLAAALDTPVRHFVEDGDAPAALAVHVQGVESPPTSTGTTRISGPADRFRANAAVHRIAEGTQRRGRRRAGEALLLVLDGTLEVTVGDEEYRVPAGASLHFPTHVGHGWANPGPGLAQYVWFAVDAAEQ